MYLEIYMYIHTQICIFQQLMKKGNEFEKELGGRVWRQEKEGENYVAIKKFTDMH